MPEMRRRRRSRMSRWNPSPRAKRTGLAALVIAVIALAVIGLAAIPARPKPDLARQEIATALGLLHAGNYSAARNHAIVATKADPHWGLAQAVLARAYLALGEGVAAEGALNRARDGGFDMSRTHQLYAQAFLIENDPQRALDEAHKASPAFAGYAVRVGARALARLGDTPGAERALAGLLAADPRNGLAWSDLGRVRYDAGDLGGAIDATGRALVADPNNLEAITLKGELVREQYGLVAALPWFESALKRDAYYHPALIEYAATLGDTGRYTEMLAATRRALATRPDSAQAFYLQAVLAMRAGNDDLARSLMAKTAGRIDDLPGALLVNGMLAYRGGAYEQAIENWRALAGNQPTNVVARRLLGAALLRSGDARGALDALRPIALRPDADSYTLALVGRAFERTGERDWAAKFLDRAAVPTVAASTPFGNDDSVAVAQAGASESDGDPAARIGYIKALLDAGNGGGALTQAQVLAQGNRGAPAAQLALGDVLAAAGRFGDAATAYGRAANLRFDEATMLRLIDAFARAGRRADAAKALALYLAQNPQNVVALRMLAHLQVAARDWGSAIATLETLRALIGNGDAALLADLSTAYTDGGDPATGAAYARAAYRLAPMNAIVSDAYGWALYQRGRRAEATPLLEKAVAIAPLQPQLRWHLAQAYAGSHRKAEALAQLKGALADPVFIDRVSAQALLKTLG